MAILNQFGLPYDRFLEAAQPSISRPQWPVRTEGIRTIVNTFDLRTVISASRRLYANMGIPKGAICQKAMFSVGRAWHPIFEGEDQAWGDAAQDWLVNEWYPICELRGGAFDFVTSLYLDSISTDRDGGFGVLLTETDDGYPMTQRIPIHRFGLRWDAMEHIIQKDEGWTNEAGKFVQSPYVGLKIHQGIIYNAQGRPVAYRVYEDAPMAQAYAAGKFKDISAMDLIHGYDPEWYDQGHGFPAFTHAVNLFRDMMQSQEWEQLNMLTSSAQSLQEFNETGSADITDPAIALANPTGCTNEFGLKTEMIEGGMIRYFRAKSGSKLEEFVNSRPGPDWDQFNDRLCRVALAGVNWPYSLVWKADGGGTDKRGDIMQARQSVEDRQDLLRPIARRIIGYAVSKAIKLGILKPYSGLDNGGFLKWAFSTPPKMGIDDGRMQKGSLDNLRSGRTTRQQDAYDLGTTWTATRVQRQKETIDLITRAQEIADATGKPFETALALMQLDNPNQAITAPPASDDEEED